MPTFSTAGDGAGNGMGRYTPDSCRRNRQHAFQDDK